MMGLLSQAEQVVAGPDPALGPMEPSGWGEVFQPFTLQHLVSVLGCAAITALVIGLGVAWRGQDRERLLRRALGIGVIITQSTSEIYWMFITPFNRSEAFPFHLCDVAVWCVAFAMLTEKRWARTVVYFLGLALSTQGFFTPTLRFGHEHVRFWFFWIGHTQIVGAALYFFIANRYRPNWRDFIVASVVTVAWLGFVFPLNLILGTNYGYVGRKDPSNPTIVQKLGPWPWRVLIMMGMTFVAFVAVWMIGEGVARFEGQRRRGFTVEDAEAES